MFAESRGVADANAEDRKDVKNVIVEMTRAAAAATAEPATATTED